MDSKHRSHNSNSGRRLSRILSASVWMTIGICISVSAQDTNGQEKTRIVDRPDSEARQFMLSALESELPERMADQMAVLAVNRSYLVVPELLERLESAHKDPTISEKFVHTMADLLAYAADETALDALTRLAVSDHERFGPFLGRALDYARGRRNPYSLAYYAIGKSTSEVDRDITLWVEMNAALGNDYRAWAMAIFERNGEMPTKAALLRDPIISRLSIGIPSALQEELLGIDRQDTTRRVKR